MKTALTRMDDSRNFCAPKQETSDRTPTTVSGMPGSVDTTGTKPGRHMTNRSRSDGQPDSLLTDSVAPTQALIDTLIWPIALLDKAGNIIRVNQAWSAAVADELGTLGSNYIKTCGASFRDNIEALSDFETSVTAILDGSRQTCLFRTSGCPWTDLIRSRCEFDRPVSHPPPRSLFSNRDRPTTTPGSQRLR